MMGDNSKCDILFSSPQESDKWVNLQDKTQNWTVEERQQTLLILESKLSTVAVADDRICYLCSDIQQSLSTSRETFNKNIKYLKQIFIISSKY